MLDEKTFSEILERNGARLAGKPGTYINGEKKSIDELYKYIQRPLTDAINVYELDTDQDEE